MLSAVKSELKARCLCCECKGFSIFMPWRWCKVCEGSGVCNYELIRLIDDDFGMDLSDLEDGWSIGGRFNTSMTVNGIHTSLGGGGVGYMNFNFDITPDDVLIASSVYGSLSLKLDADTGIFTELV